MSHLSHLEFFLNHRFIAQCSIAVKYLVPYNTQPKLQREEMYETQITQNWSRHKRSEKWRKRKKAGIKEQRFGKFEDYKRRLGNLAVRWSRLWWKPKSSGKKRLGALSDCKITITMIKYSVRFSCSICGHRSHQISNFGDKMQYRVLGGYDSPYGKSMTRFITDWSHWCCDITLLWKPVTSPQLL